MADSSVKVAYVAPSTGGISQYGQSAAQLYRTIFSQSDDAHVPEMCGLFAVALANVLAAEQSQLEQMVESISVNNHLPSMLHQLRATFEDAQTKGIGAGMLALWEVEALLFDQNKESSGVSLIRWLIMDPEAEDEYALHAKTNDRLPVEEYYKLLATDELAAKAYFFPCGNPINEDEVRVAHEEAPFRQKPGPALCVQVGPKEFISWQQWQASGGSVGVVDLGGHWVAVAPVQVGDSRQLIVASSADGGYETCEQIAVLCEILNYDKLG